LKVLQEAITLVVFAVFAVVVLGDKFRWTDIAAFVLIFAGVAVSMSGRSPAAKVETPAATEALTIPATPASP
jgi:drug/metabolite transporter (DMT)-like permease